MTPDAIAFLGLTAIVGALLAVLTFAVLRIFSAARSPALRESGADSTMLAAALQEAVTKLKAQERAMSARAVASEELSGQIVSSLTAGLLVVDGTGRVEILNPAGRRMLAVSSDPVGGDYREVLATVPPLVEAITECLGTRRAILRRSLQIAGAERSTHLGATVSPLGGPEGYGGAICLFSDLTNVFELEEQLRLKETLARLGELTAGIAHEFRNGLATIHGYSRLIAPDALPPQYRPYVEGIRQETEALGKVVTNFLSFARPERIALSHVDLGPLLRRLAEDLQHELPAGTSLDVFGTFAAVDGDEVLLRQVFSNLVRNAAEACEAAGVMPAIIIGGDVDGKRRTCRVSVEDNGPGIPAADRARVFQPFVTTRSRGTGLGLAIVQKVVVMHNGRVAIGTSPAGGASVDVTLPLAAA